MEPKLKRVVVHMGLRAVDLTEDRSLVLGRRRGPVDADLSVEGQFRAGKHANGGGRICRRHEAARASAEIGRPQFITHLGGTRFDVHQTVVAHRRTPLFTLRVWQRPISTKVHFVAMSDPEHMRVSGPNRASPGQRHTLECDWRLTHREPL